MSFRKWNISQIKKKDIWVKIKHSGNICSFQFELFLSNRQRRWRKLLQARSTVGCCVWSSSFSGTPYPPVQLRNCSHTSQVNGQIRASSLYCHINREHNIIFSMSYSHNLHIKGNSKNLHAVIHVYLVFKQGTQNQLYTVILHITREHKIILSHTSQVKS